MPIAIDPPPLTDEQWRRLARHGDAVDTVAGQELITAGQRWYPLVAVEDGVVDVLRPANRLVGERRIAAVGARRFVGELGVLSGQEAFLTARVATPGRALLLRRDAVRRLMAEDGELGDVLLHLLWQRRESLATGPAALTLEIVGHEYAGGTLALRTYAARFRLPHTWIDADDAVPLERWGLRQDDLPAVVVQGEPLPRATPGVLAERLGLAWSPAEDAAVDLAVIGGGPAGLAAAISAASEGLSTVLIDRVAPGGQAASTSRIENYLGFPYGVSGGELTGSAQLQALKFGVRIFAPCEAVALSSADGLVTLALGDGSQVVARSAVLATGAAYRRLAVDRWTDFEDAGIYYAATALEGQEVAGSPVVVVGGANSAGQASLYLASLGCAVHLVVRRTDLAATMSDYLVERLLEEPRITVHLGAEVTGLDGGAQLRAVRLSTGRAIDCAGLFCFIGAEPATGWLPQPAKDARGFLLTGVEAAPNGSDVPARLPFETDVPGVFAVGDVRHGSMKRVAAAVGEGSSAVASVHQALARVRAS
jgi:thioredoxin reductase (NADPH)